MTTIELPYMHSFVDRHGHARYYFRYRGNRWALPAPGDPGFTAEYEAKKKLVTENPLQALGKVAFMVGTLGWAIDQFLASEEYDSRAKTTKRYDRRILDEIKKRYGAGKLPDLTAKHAKLIRNEFAKTYSTSTAKVAIGLLSTVWKFADERLDDVDLDANPTEGVSRLHKSTKEHEQWPDDVLTKFEKAANLKLLLAFLLARYTGQRRSDLVKMQWSQFDGESIDVKQQKGGAFLTIPCHHRLRDALLAVMPKNKAGYILTKERGKGPFGPEGLSVAFRRALGRLKIKGYSIHGLRKNATSALAEAGCTDREIMAITGHQTTAMVTHYSKRADQKRRAKSAMAKWENAESGNPKNARGAK